MRVHLPKNYGIMALTPFFILMLKKTKNCYMSLKEEERKILVTLELERVDKILNEIIDKE